MEAGPPAGLMPPIVASTHCPLLLHPASDRDSKPSWHRSHLSPIAPGLQLQRPSLSHWGPREPAERQEGEAGMGTFQPKSSCEFVIISAGRWALKPAAGYAGAQSLPCPGAQQVPKAARPARRCARTPGVAEAGQAALLPPPSEEALLAALAAGPLRVAQAAKAAVPVPRLPQELPVEDALPGHPVAVTDWGEESRKTSQIMQQSHPEGQGAGCRCCKPPPLLLCQQWAAFPHLCVCPHVCAHQPPQCHRCPHRALHPHTGRNAPFHC